MTVQEVALRLCRVPTARQIFRALTVCLVASLCIVGLRTVGLTVRQYDSLDFKSLSFHSHTGGPPQDVGPPCLAIPETAVAELKQASQRSIYTFKNGRVLEEQDSVSTGDAVCIIVVVPQIPVADGVYYEVPVAEKGPDVVHLFVNSSAISITFPPLDPRFPQSSLTELFAPGSILYQVEATFADAGVYDLIAEQESANWAWVRDEILDLKSETTNYTTGIIEPIKEYPENATAEEKFQGMMKLLPDPIPVTLENRHPPTITVEGSPTLENRPSCDDKLSSYPGRWYHQSAHPEVHESMIDEWGYGWVPDQCKLDYFDDDEVMDCFRDKTIHVYGDSNARRISRTLLNGGIWCMGPNERCQDEDRYDPLYKLVPDEEDESHLRMERDDSERFAEGDAEGIFFGHNAALYYNFVGSVAQMSVNWMEWLLEPDEFTFDKTDLWPDPFDPQVNLKDGAVRSRPPPDQDKADLVILGFGAWDQAFDARASDYIRTLPYFRDAIMAAYPDSQISLRLSNGYCCRYNVTDIGWRRWSGQRVERFIDITRDAFKVNGVRGMNGRIGVIDSSYTTGRPEVTMDYGNSLANHPRASHVRLETQMILNQVCERDPFTRKVIFRARR